MRRGVLSYALPMETTSPRVSGTIWLTGLPGAGKTTLAEQLAVRLRGTGRAATVLDGDTLRQGISKGLGLDRAGRDEAVRRAGEAALHAAQQGELAIVALVSPYRAARDAVRARHSAAGLAFAEVHIDCPLAVVQQRDPKGLYAKAAAGTVTGMTGVDDPYEPPTSPELRLVTNDLTVADCVAALLDLAARMRAS